MQYELSERQEQTLSRFLNARTDMPLERLVRVIARVIPSVPLQVVEDFLNNKRDEAVDNSAFAIREKWLKQWRIKISELTQLRPRLS